MRTLLAKLHTKLPHASLRIPDGELTYTAPEPPQQTKTSQITPPLPVKRITAIRRNKNTPQARSSASGELPSLLKTTDQHKVQSSSQIKSRRRSQNRNPTQQKRPHARALFRPRWPASGSSPRRRGRGRRHKSSNVTEGRRKQF